MARAGVAPRYARRGRLARALRARGPGTAARAPARVRVLDLHLERDAAGARRAARRDRARLPGLRRAPRRRPTLTADDLARVVPARDGRPGARRVRPRRTQPGRRDRRRDRRPAHPQRVRRLVLIDAAGFNLAAADRPAVVRAARGGAARGLRAAAARRGRRRHWACARSSTTTAWSRASAWTSTWRRWCGPGTAAALRSLLTSRDGLDVPAQVARIRPPTLVIWGRDDRWIDVSHAGALRGRDPRLAHGRAATAAATCRRRSGPRSRPPDLAFLAGDGPGSGSVSRRADASATLLRSSGDERLAGLLGDLATAGRGSRPSAARELRLLAPAPGHVDLAEHVEQLRVVLVGRQGQGALEDATPPPRTLVGLQDGAQQQAGLLALVERPARVAASQARAAAAAALSR